MQRLLLVLLFIFSVGAKASQPSLFEHDQKDDWSFGVGWGQQSLYSYASQLELKTPTLFTFGYNIFSLAFVLENKTLAGSEGNKHSISPMNLLLNMSTPMSHEGVRFYFRLGVGHVLVGDKPSLLADRRTVFQVQAGMGAEWVLARSQVPSSFSAFFVQAMHSTTDASVPAGQTDVFEGTLLSIGLRSYF